MKPFWIAIGGLLLVSVTGMIWATATLMSQPDTEVVAQFTEPLPTDYCWNKVVESEGETPYWPDACNTPETAEDEICAQVIKPLTEEQFEEYQGWKVAGKPELIGC